MEIEPNLNLCKQWRDKRSETKQNRASDVKKIVTEGLPCCMGERWGNDTVEGEKVANILAENIHFTVYGNP